MIQKEKIRGVGYFLMALATGLLPFAAPDACAQALREGLALCGGPLLLSLFPFLIVSTLLIQCPAADVLGLPFCPVARLIGVRAPAAGRVLLIGSLGGFAPAASAVAGAVRSGQLTAREADALLPACVCSGPSFVILAVGQSMLGSAELGVLLFLAQVAAGYLSAALLARLGGTLGSMAHPAVPTASQPLRLDGIIAQASQTYLKLCGFVLFFRMLAAGAGEALPSGAGVLCAMLLEVCSGCDLAAKSGRFASMPMLNNTTGTTGQWSGTSFQSDFLMGRRSWALLLWVVLWLATLTMGGHWKSIAYARTAHAMPVQCFTQQHGGRPARWDISVW